MYRRPGFLAFGVGLPARGPAGVAWRKARRCRGGNMLYQTRGLAVLALAAGAALGMGVAGPAVAQNFTRQVTIIVPYAPGGTSDILARLIGPKLSEAIGQPVIVENKPSASGNIGADFVAKAAGDGHTLLIT